MSPPSVDPSFSWVTPPLAQSPVQLLTLIEQQRPILEDGRTGIGGDADGANTSGDLVLVLEGGEIR